MANAQSINKLKKTFLNKLSSTYGILISIFTILGGGFAVGNYYRIVISNGEISELKNKHTLEIIELNNKYSEKISDIKSEIVVLQNKISLLEIENEKQKK